MVHFLTHLLGGPDHYTGPSMHALHKHMHLKGEDFDLNWEHMENAFLVFKLDKKLIEELKGAIYTTKTDIVSS
jgi:truncated hemoglobin YjbI